MPNGTLASLRDQDVSQFSAKLSIFATLPSKQEHIEQVRVSYAEALGTNYRTRSYVALW